MTSGVYERTQRHRDKLSKTMKQWHKTHSHPLKGKKLGTAWNYGLSHTEETKERISISMKEWWSKPGVKKRMKAIHTKRNHSV